PMTWPVSPTCRAAKKQSMPPPLPRSNTVSPGLRPAILTGSPQPSDKPVTSTESPSSRDISYRLLPVPQSAPSPQQALDEALVVSQHDAACSAGLSIERAIAP